MRHIILNSSVATLKKVKLILMFYRTQYIRNVNISKYSIEFVNRVFYILFAFKIGGLYTHCRSRFGLATYQMLTGHIWLVAMIGREKQKVHSEVDNWHNYVSSFIFQLRFGPK